MRKERLIFLDRKYYISLKDLYEEDNIKKMLIGSIFKEYENWLKKELGSLTGGFGVNDYIEKPLETLMKYLNENRKSNDIIEIILMYTDSEIKRIENTINKTKLEADVLYDVLVQKYIALYNVFDTDLKNQKMDLLMDVLESIVTKIEVFEKSYFKEVEKRRDSVARPKNEEVCITKSANYCFDSMEVKIASENTGNFFYCVF